MTQWRSLGVGADKQRSLLELSFEPYEDGYLFY